LEVLSDDELDVEAERVGAALAFIDRIKGYGDTATAKFFHRLRPNLGPLWDGRVGRWYGRCDWTPWVRRVYAEVREPGTLRCLLAVRAQECPQLSLLRIWDLLLWQWAEELD
jgi:hypothetical protein